MACYARNERIDMAEQALTHPSRNIGPPLLSLHPRSGGGCRLIALAITVCAVLTLAFVGSLGGWPTGMVHEPPQPQAIQSMSRACQELVQTEASLQHSTGWYTHPDDGELIKLALQTKTDKVTMHNYHVMYGTLFDLAPGLKSKVKKMLEIGLGCNMGYGPGASAALWREYLPDTEIWFAEYDKACVDRHMANITARNISVVTGDQANFTDLHRWISTSGGNFDVIIDDGGHTNEQQYNSFVTLFPKALKPGGVYVIEDLNAEPKPGPNMVKALMEWIENLAGFPYQYERGHKYPMPLRIRSIQCAPEACMITKCYEDDPRCTYNGLDNPAVANPAVALNAGYAWRTIAEPQAGPIAEPQGAAVSQA